MLSKLRILDERTISPLVSGDVLEIQDHKGNLVGEKPLTFYVESNMTEDEIIDLFAENGVDLNSLCEEIITEAVMVEQMYDLWITEESVIFYSPSQEQFVAEPIQGIFAKIVEAFEESAYTEIDDNQTEVFETQGTDNQNVIEAEITEIADQVQNQAVNDTYVADTVPAPAESEETLLVNEKQAPANQPEEDDLATLRDAIPNKEHMFRTAEQEQQIPSPATIEQKEAFKEEFRQNGETGGQQTKENAWVLPTEEKRIVSEWKEDYLLSLKNAKRVKGISMGQLRDKVVEIILDSNKSPFEVEEKEVLFRLATEMEAIFDTTQAIRAGLYQSYLILRD